MKLFRTRYILQRLLLTLLLASSAWLGFAADVGKPDDANATKRNALDSFKRGDGAAGINTLKGNPGSSARSADAQLVDDLKEVVFWMMNENHPRARESAIIAVGEAERAKGRLNPAEDADVSTSIGVLSERITGDMAKAKSSYEAALRANPAHEEASKGLKRIQLLEALVAAKARETEALRNRKQQSPRP
jgi:hypothetical protein